MRDYMTWLVTYHRKMLDDWEQFKRDRDARRATWIPSTSGSLS